MTGISRLNTRLPDELNDWLDIESARTGLSKNAIVLFSIENYRKEKEVLTSMANMGELVAKIEQMEKVIQRKGLE